jgi:hypothetical protein
MGVVVAMRSPPDRFETLEERLHMFHTPKSRPGTVHGGYFDNSLSPVLRIRTGDLIQVETITHQAGDAPDLLMDDAIRELYESIHPDDRTPGVHIMIYRRGESRRHSKSGI